MNYIQEGDVLWDINQGDVGQVVKMTDKMIHLKFIAICKTTPFLPGLKLGSIIRMQLSLFHKTDYVKIATKFDLNVQNAAQSSQVCFDRESGDNQRNGYDIFELGRGLV